MSDGILMTLAISLALNLVAISLLARRSTDHTDQFIDDMAGLFGSWKAIVSVHDDRPTRFKVIGITRAGSEELSSVSEVSQEVAMCDLVSQALTASRSKVQCGCCGADYPRADLMEGFVLCKACR